MAMIGLKTQNKFRRLCRTIASAFVTGLAAMCFFAADADDLHALSVTVIHAASPETALRFDIPAQPLGPALTAYSSITGIPLFYNSRLAVDRQSQSVIGTFDAEQALAVLLGDTGLAPLETSHNSITLVLRAPEAAVAAGIPAAAPQMALPPMYVTASPIGDHQFYAAAVRYSIRSALQRTSVVKRHSYQVDIDVWVSPAGTIRQAEILAPIGRTDIEQAIAHTIHGLVVGTPPPTTLPQPVHVSILVSGSSS